jgi:hypothetical protein
MRAMWARASSGASGREEYARHQRSVRLLVVGSRLTALGLQDGMVERGGRSFHHLDQLVIPVQRLPDRIVRA